MFSSKSIRVPSWSPTPAPEVRRNIVILAAAARAFGGTLAGKFLFDDAVLFNDPAITSPSGWLDCWRPLQTRPLTWFTFWINDRFGADPLQWPAFSPAHCSFDLFRKLIPERPAFSHL
jgi:hypothetical protein